MRGERRVDIVPHVGVATADDREILRHAQSAGTRFTDYAEGQNVAGADDCGGTAVEREQPRRRALTLTPR
jgi:hypothetical protein